jgi:hypothetical protein
MVLTLVSRKIGEVSLRTIPNVSGETLREAISKNVNRAMTYLHADSAHTR